jgi:hypothetical protein
MADSCTGAAGVQGGCLSQDEGLEMDWEVTEAGRRCRGWCLLAVTAVPTILPGCCHPLNSWLGGGAAGVWRLS